MDQKTPFIDHGWIIIAGLLIGSVAMVAVIWWYYALQRRAIESATSQELVAIAQYKVNQIASWRRERIGDGRVQSTSAIMRIATRVLSSPVATASDQADLLDSLRKLQLEFGYTGTALVDRAGSIRIQSTPNQPVPSRIQQFARAGAVSNDVRLEDLYMDSLLGRPLMALTIPVKDLGAMILEIDPSRFLYPYIGSWPGASASAETHLVRREGESEILQLSDLRYRPGTALVLRRRVGKLPDDRQLDSGWTTTTGTDYRGAQVVGVVRRIPDSPWYLVAKIDRAEIEAPVRRLAWEMGFLTGLIGLANMAGAGLILRGQQTQILREREAWFYAVANDTPAYLWMSSPGQENTFINRPFAKLLGTENHSLSDGWVDTLHPDDAGRARATFLECAAVRREYVVEFRVRRFDGEYRRVVSHGVPRFSPTDEFLGYAGSIIDITERREAEEQLLVANTALAAELAERTRNEIEIQSLNARLINAQEEERTRLARELHDDLSQQIAALSMATSNLKRRIPNQETDVRNQCDRIHEKLVHAAEIIRRISHALHPAVLEHLGLRPALQAYCNEFESLTGIRVCFESDACFERVPDSIGLGLYRITQEALQNVAKHAQTQGARVELRNSNGVRRLIVSDEGVGFGMDGGPAWSGLGFISIKERARLLNGSVEIWSQEAQGTRITVQIPEWEVSQAGGVASTTASL